MSGADLVLAYFAMWNSGDASRIRDLLAQEWSDAAHPEVSGPDGVAASISAVRTARPDLRFELDDVVDDGDWVVATGGVAGSPTRLKWTFRVAAGRLIELRTETVG